MTRYLQFINCALIVIGSFASQQVSAQLANPADQQKLQEEHGYHTYTTPSGSRVTTGNGMVIERWTSANGDKNTQIGRASCRERVLVAV